MNTLAETKVRLIASPKSWIEGEAVRQLYATARFDGVRLAVGFPDLHPLYPSTLPPQPGGCDANPL